MVKYFLAEYSKVDNGRILPLLIIIFFKEKCIQCVVITLIMINFTALRHLFYKKHANKRLRKHLSDC